MINEISLSGGGATVSRLGPKEAVEACASDPEMVFWEGEQLGTHLLV